jgi:uncharacterized protein (TIGR00369 family)
MRKRGCEIVGLHRGLSGQKRFADRRADLRLICGTCRTGGEHDPGEKTCAKGGSNEGQSHGFLTDDCAALAWPTLKEFATLVWRVCGSNVAGTILQCSVNDPISETMTEAESITAPGVPANAENISIAGFNRFAGPFYRLADEGAARRFAFVALPHHMNGAGTVHGGLLMTFADIAMSRTSRLISGAQSCSTVALNCDFVGPGRLGDLIVATVRATRQTRTLVFLGAELSTAGRMVMTATGLWKIVP